MHEIGSRLDAFELWVAGLPFVPQCVLMLAVIMPIAFGLAWLTERLLTMFFALVVHRKSAQVEAAEHDTNPIGR